MGAWLLQRNVKNKSQESPRPKALDVGTWSFLLRLVPHPILGRLHRIIRVVLERMSEVMTGTVAVNEQDRRDEFLPVLFQLIGRDGGLAARKVPMIIVLKPVG